MLPAAPPPGPPPGPPPRRRASRAALLAVAAVVVLAAGVAAVIATRSTKSTPANTGPLHVGSNVALTVSPASGGCGSAFAFVATGSLSGVGDLLYRWEQSDGGNTPDLKLAIDSTKGSFELHQSWRLQGSRQVKGTMTFHILAPDQRSATAKISYSCS